MQHEYRGRELTVSILFSAAGVAQHILVSRDSDIILVDCGDGCLRDLLDHNIPPDSISALTFTHGHFDHMGGLHSLLGFLRMIGRTEPLPIHAPEGCTEVFATVHNFRRCYPESIPYRIPLLELKPHEPFNVGSVTVEGYAVTHAGSTAAGITDPIPALGYRITAGPESVAITGDTGLCEEVRALVTDTDFAVIEATFPDTDCRPPETFEKVHLTEEMARELGALARNYVLVHGALR